MRKTGNAQTLPAPLSKCLKDAESALARLNLLGTTLPLSDWLVFTSVRREAVLSAQLEGLQVTLLEVFTLQSADDLAAPSAELNAALSYLGAVNFARTALASSVGRPVFMDLLRGARGRLMLGARGSLPAVDMSSADHLSLEEYIHSDDGRPPLVKLALIFARFEMIHPYRDEGGRLGRLLVLLLLQHWGLLSQPLLGLSLFFKQHQPEYVRHQIALRTKGNWEGWTEFFLRGVAEVAEESVLGAGDQLAQISEDRRRALASPRATLAASRLFELLPRNPVVTVAFVTSYLGVSRPTAARAIEVLEEAGVLAPKSERMRDRIWTYQTYLSRLRVGIDVGCRLPAVIR